MKLNPISRRRFLKSAAATFVAAPVIIPSSALGADGSTAPSERITIGFIGDTEANTWLDRARRDPWQLPKV